MKRTLLVGSAIASFAVGLLTSPAQSQSGVKFDHKVRDKFFAGFSGSPESLADGMKITARVLAENPTHAEALVWQGSGYLFLSGTEFRAGNSERSIELWERGLKEMDEAVALDPQNIGVRVPRGAALLNVTRYAPPEMAHGLLEKGLADYEAVYRIQKGNLDKLGTHPLGELLFGLGEGYARKGDKEKAKVYFEQIDASLPNTVYARRARLWLETGNIPREQTGCVGCHVTR